MNSGLQEHRVAWGNGHQLGVGIANAHPHMCTMLLDDRGELPPSLGRKEYKQKTQGSAVIEEGRVEAPTPEH